VEDTFHRIARGASAAVGRSTGFIVALVVVMAWAVTGPMFHFSDTWQLVINTGTTIVTFLMVFLIQNTQNREAKAVQLKLDELLRATRKARNTFLDLEDLTDAEIKELEAEFRQRCQRARAERDNRTERRAGGTGNH
jgi:low affinity Fe/Cu permease